MTSSPMKSEIRDSLIRELIEKVNKGSYDKYIKSIHLSRIRLFEGATIEFSFPVTALIGPNGSGKSTILNAAACAYKEILPQYVFLKSRVGDDAMNNWSLQYTIIDKALNPKGSISTLLSFQDNSWTRSEEIPRSVKILSLNRTVPATENPLFSFRNQLSINGKAKRTFNEEHIEVKNIDTIKQESERILGKSLEHFKLLEVQFSGIIRHPPAKIKSIFVGPSYEQVLDNGFIRVIREKIAINPLLPIEQQLSPDQLAFHNRKSKKHSNKDYRPKQFLYTGMGPKGAYSEFNFGSGEASVIRMVADIESLQEGSLVLIEEIENGLHPLAVTRMVEYLIDVAKRKRIQTIFTTHSDYALQPLPSEAIWACLEGTLQKGKLSVEALRAISGRVDRRLAIFVEDSFAQEWLTSIIRSYLGNSIDEIGIYPLHGDGNAVKNHKHHSQNPAVDFHSICFIDGDSRQADDEAKGIYRLPGQAPETTIFNNIVENLSNNIAILTVACHFPLEKQDFVQTAIRNISRTNRDPHLLFSQIGLALSFTAEAIIRSAFINLWISQNPDACQKIIISIKQHLETSKDRKKDSP